MKKRLFVAFVGAVVSIVVTAEAGLNVTVKLSQQVYLPGEPITAYIILTNTSGTPVIFFAPTVKEGIRANARLRNEGGELLACSSQSGCLIVRQSPNVPPPESTLKPGESIQLDCPADTFSCPLSQFPAGQYILVVEVTKLPKWEKEPWPLLALVEKKIEIAAPAGDDLAAIRAIEKAIATTDPKQLHGPTLQQKPLTWGDVLQSLRINSSAIILSQFPASTYTGYAIAKKLIDLSDWRFKVGSPASIIEGGKQHPDWATRSQSDVDLFNLAEKHIQGGNVPESLRAVLYCYYGEQLALRGRDKEAEAAFCEAAKEKPCDAKGIAYYDRARGFLKALGKTAP